VSQSGLRRKTRSSARRSAERGTEWQRRADDPRSGKAAIARTGPLAQLELLKRAPSFRLLFLAALGSGVGTYLAFVALAVDVWDRTESGTWVAWLLIADFLPAIAIGLLLGALLDRRSRRQLMVAADLVRFAVFCALPFTTQPWQIVVLAGVAGFATGFFRPAVYAGLPNLVADADLPHANSLLQGIENLAITVGPLAGGVLVAGAGTDLAYWINAATFLVSAALLIRIPARLLQAASAPSEGHLRDLAAGFRLVRRSRALATVLLAWGGAMFAVAGVNVAEVALAKDAFDAGDFGYGLMLGATGFGLVLGSLYAASVIERRGIGPVYGVSLGLLAFGYGCAAISPDVWIASLALVLSGGGNGVALVCNSLLVQRGVPDRLRGRAFTLLMSANFAVLGVGMLLAGPATDAVGPRWVWGAAAAIMAVAAGIGWLLARGVTAQPAETRAEPVPHEAEIEAAGRPV
jgi:MFS family permease